MWNRLLEVIDSCSLASSVSTVGETAEKERDMELLAGVSYGENYLNEWVEACLPQALPVLCCFKAHLVHPRSECFLADEPRAASIFIGGPCSEQVPASCYRVQQMQT